MTSLSPWLTVRDTLKAFDFYQQVFGAAVVYRMDYPGGVVARLSIDGAEFWIGDESQEHFNFSPETLRGCSVRLILTVDDPDTLVKKLIAHGCKQIYPVTEEHGWRIGRVADPFGHHWEVGTEVK